MAKGGNHTRPDHAENHHELSGEEREVESGTGVSTDRAEHRMSLQKEAMHLFTYLMQPSNYVSGVPSPEALRQRAWVPEISP